MWAAIRARLRRTAPEEPSDRPGSPSPVAGGPAPTTGPSPPTSPEAGPFTESVLGRKIRESTLDDTLDQLEIALLQSDVALPVVERILADLRRDLSGRRLRWGVDAEAAIRTSLARSLRSILALPPIDLLARIRHHPRPPFVILFLGVNGTGKTTSIAKIARWLDRQGIRPVIAASDTFRAGAIEQLLVHGERLKVRVVHQQEGSDPAAVAFDSIAHARASGAGVVLVDTAGRQHTNENLIAEARKIRRVAQPDLTLFVGDALSGNDVVEQARLFQEALGFDGIVLTKVDADTKGGGALSAVFVTQRPVLFVGTGQGYEDLRPFDPDWMVARLLAEAGAS
ncbi:MAG: signal recognition particle-docking protein FtsY [Thermoplasmata archaeon]